MPDPRPVLLTPGEVAGMLRVDPATVARWARTGRLRVVRTPGGHRRYFRADIEAILRVGEGAETGGR